MIEASFTKQYGIRIRYEADKMPFTEFFSLLAGLMPDTPLGQIVSIRSETDEEILKNFTPEQNRIRNEWLTKVVSQKYENNSDQYEKDMKNLSNQLNALFGKKGGK